LHCGARKSEESSCATRAMKETKMTNTDSHDKHASENTIGGSAVEKPAAPRARAVAAKAALRGGHWRIKPGRGGTRTRTGAQSARKATGMAKLKARTESKGPRASFLGPPAAPHFSFRAGVPPRRTCHTSSANFFTREILNEKRGKTSAPSRSIAQDRLRRTH
jgi:hypothetical protein